MAHRLKDRIITMCLFSFSDRLPEQDAKHRRPATKSKHLLRISCETNSKSAHTARHPTLLAPGCLVVNAASSVHLKINMVRPGLVWRGVLWSGLGNSFAFMENNLLMQDLRPDRLFQPPKTSSRIAQSCGCH